MLWKRSAVAVIGVLLVSAAFADDGNNRGSVDNYDRGSLGNGFGNMGGSGIGWSVAQNNNNIFNFTDTNGNAGAVAWGFFFPRVIIATFNSTVRSAATLTTRTGYAFFGAYSINAALLASSIGFGEGNPLTWTLTATDQAINGVDVKNLTYTKTFTLQGQQVVVTVENLVLKTGGTITVNGVAYTATAGGVKSTYKVSNWPFGTSALDKLHLGIVINSNGKGTTNATLTTVGARFGIGNGQLITPTVATANNAQVACNVTAFVRDDGENGNGDVLELVIVSFAKFTNTLVYDPVNALGSTNTGGNGASAVTVSLIALIAMILSVFVF